MTRIQQLEKTFGYLLLIAIVFAIHVVARKASVVGDTSAPLLRASCLVGIKGAVRWPGVYGFDDTPSLGALIKRAGGLKENLSLKTNGLRAASLCFKTIEIRPMDKVGAAVQMEPIDAYKKITLGLRLDLNSESVQGLTAIPGIGIRTAKAIVAMRDKLGSIRSMSQIASIPGIGSKTVKRISRYTTLTSLSHNRSSSK